MLFASTNKIKLQNNKTFPYPKKPDNDQHSITIINHQSVIQNVFPQNLKLRTSTVSYPPGAHKLNQLRRTTFERPVYVTANSAKLIATLSRSGIRSVIGRRFTPSRVRSDFVNFLGRRKKNRGTVMGSLFRFLLFWDCDCLLVGNCLCIVIGVINIMVFLRR